jgi:hypothetical protein
VRRHAKATSTRSAHAAEPTRATSRKARGMFGMVCLCAVALAAFLGSGAPSAGADSACANEGVRTEQHSTFLPDCRAYEQVSPVDKQGNDVMPFSPRTRAAADGEAVQFASLGGFGDVRGAGIAFEYLARRGPDGWATHAITPKIAATSPNDRGGLSEALYQGEFSPDLSKGAFAAPRPLAGTPDSVSGVPNLYLRDDLLTPGEGHYQLLTACPLCEEPGGEALPPASTISASLQSFLPQLVGASPDMKHILFESIQRLTGDTPPQSSSCGNEHFTVTPPSFYYCASHIYEWDNGNLRLASVLPSGEPADEAIAATGAGAGSTPNSNRPHVVSDGSDGHSRVEFTQPTVNFAGMPLTFSQVGALFGEDAYLAYFHLGIFGNITEGNLFQRIDGTETIKLNESERTEGEPSEFAPAQYLDASANGEHVFFMTSQALTNDAEPSGRKIYVYDATKPASASDNLTLVTPPGSSANVLLGSGGDGHYAYYASGNRISMWHDGVTDDFGRAPIALYNELPTDGVQWAVTLRQTRVTPDGRHLIFVDERSPFPAGGYDHSHSCNNGFGCREFYVYSADTGQLACASCNPSGAAATGDAFVTGGSGAHGLADASLHENRAVSADGRWVFFSSPENLVPGDTNGKYDAYEYDTATGEVHLLSSGTDEHDSYFIEAGEDGRDVFIDTRERLVGHDTDNAYDLYDVRVGGGYPEPIPVPAACTGESCQGAQSAAPAAPAVGSGAVRAGNPGQASSCRAPTRRAQRFSHQAKKLRRKARRALRHGNKRAAHKLARAAKARAKRAHRLSRSAKRCRHSNRGVGK